MRAFLATLPMVQAPQEPGVILLAQGGKVVYVTGSAYGLFGPTISAHARGTRLGVQAKEFSTVFFVSVPEDLLDQAVAAFVRYFRPKLNRVQRSADLEDLDQARRDRKVLRFLGVQVDDPE